MYLSKLPNVFVQIAKSICPNCQKNISGTQYAQVQDSGDGEGEEGDGGGRRGEEQEEGQESVNIRIVFVQIAKYICPNCRIYLSKFHIAFLQIFKFIYPNI